MMKGFYLPLQEVNEVLLKVSGGEKPTPLWSADPMDQDSSRDPILYKLYFKLKVSQYPHLHPQSVTTSPQCLPPPRHLQGIQITATTPTANAVRFETSEIEMELSNRVKKTSAVDHGPKGS